MTGKLVPQQEQNALVRLGGSSMTPFDPLVVSWETYVHPLNREREFTMIHLQKLEVVGFVLTCQDTREQRVYRIPETVDQSIADPAIAEFIVAEFIAQILNGGERELVAKVPLEMEIDEIMKLHLADDIILAEARLGTLH